MSRSDTRNDNGHVQVAEVGAAGQNTFGPHHIVKILLGVIVELRIAWAGWELLWLDRIGRWSLEAKHRAAGRLARLVSHRSPDRVRQMEIQRGLV